MARKKIIRNKKVKETRHVHKVLVPIVKVKIEIPREDNEYLKQICEELTWSMGRKVTFTDVIRSLISDLVVGMGYRKKKIIKIGGRNGSIKGVKESVQSE